jgi:glycosyltransferase involved in cell wall biosynthesis
LRIAIAIHSMSAGGAERVAATLANAWSARGHQVAIVTLAPESLDSYPLHPDVKRIALGLAWKSGSIAAAIGFNMRRIGALRRVLRQLSPDVVLAMMTTSNVLAVLAMLGSGVPVVTSERTHPGSSPIGRLWGMLRRYTYPHAQAVVALTRESAEWLETHCPGSRTTVIANPISWPLTAAEPRKDPGDTVASGRRMLLAVGRLSPEKGFDCLIRAFARVADAHSQWDLVILGEGPERPRLERHVEQSRVGARIHLPGRAGNIGDWYARADLFVLSSRFEGFPNALVEAMSYGCPAVSFDCDTGPRDVIRPDVDGLLVAPARGEDGLADALSQLMSDDDRRRQMGARARDVRERFSLASICQQWEALFSELQRA